MGELDEDDPLPNYPHEFPLVAERSVRKAASDAKGHALDFGQTQLVNLGFPWNYCLPYHLARKWKSEKYPTEPTREAVDQWKTLYRECSAFGAIGGIGNTEENFLEYLENDMKLLAQFDPKLVEPSDLPPSQKELADKQQEEKRWSKPNSPTQWAKVYGVSYSTIIRWLRAQKIRNKKLTTKSYRIDMDDLPDEYKQRMKELK